jgi:hypothetical protein
LEMTEGEAIRTVLYGKDEYGKPRIPSPKWTMDPNGFDQKVMDWERRMLNKQQRRIVKHLQTELANTENIYQEQGERRWKRLGKNELKRQHRRNERQQRQKEKLRHKQALHRDRQQELSHKQKKKKENQQRRKERRQELNEWLRQERGKKKPLDEQVVDGIVYKRVDMRAINA